MVRISYRGVFFFFSKCMQVDISKCENIYKKEVSDEIVHTLKNHITQSGNRADEWRSVVSAVHEDGSWQLTRLRLKQSGAESSHEQSRRTSSVQQDLLFFLSSE